MLDRKAQPTLSSPLCRPFFTRDPWFLSVFLASGTRPSSSHHFHAHSRNSPAANAHPACFVRSMFLCEFARGTCLITGFVAGVELSSEGFRSLRDRSLCPQAASPNRRGQTRPTRVPSCCCHPRALLSPPSLHLLLPGLCTPCSGHALQTQQIFSPPSPPPHPTPGERQALVIRWQWGACSRSSRGPSPARVQLPTRFASRCPHCQPAGPGEGEAWGWC